MTTAAGSPELSGELERLVEAHRHLREEHRRAGVNSRARRRLERRLASATERFERRLRETTLHEHSRELWRRHFSDHAAPPGPSESATPIVFRGRSEAGSELLIRRLPSGELEVTVDRIVVERLADADEILSTSPHLSFPVGDQLYRETFHVEEGALEGLAEILATGRPFPGRQALIQEGLLGRNLELTPRGRRALAQRPEAPGAPLEEGSPIEIVARGDVDAATRERLHDSLTRITARASRPVLFVRGTLTREENRSLARPAIAEATIELSGRVIQASAQASGFGEAIALLVERLERAMRELRRAEEAERRDPGVASPGSWRHGSLSSHRRR